MDLTALGNTLALVAVAELGDRSQLLCMALAARMPPYAVLLGAALAFAVQNALAVAVGATLGAVLPDAVIAWAPAVVFLLFGVLMLARPDEDEDEDVEPTSGRGAVLTTFGLLLVAEIGDKTQWAVLALASTEDPLAVWTGATVALTGTSALGIAAGALLHRWLSPRLVRVGGGLMFLAFGLVSAWRAWQG